MHIGKQLLLLRKKKGMSQTELARRSGLANATVCDIEKGRLTPSLKSLRKLAAALGVSAGYLIDVQDVPDVHDITAGQGEFVESRSDSVQEKAEEG